MTQATVETAHRLPKHRTLIRLDLRHLLRHLLRRLSRDRQVRATLCSCSDLTEPTAQTMSSSIGRLPR